MRPVPAKTRFVLPLIVLLALPVAAQGQERLLFTWTGRVDRQVRLSMEDSETRLDAERGERHNGRFRVSNAMPRREGTVRVVSTGGRGVVTVLQQPDADNDYSVVIRVADHSPGADRYQVMAYFTPGARSRPRRDRDDDDRRGRDDRDRDGRGRRDDDDRRGDDRGRGDDRRSGQPSVLRWMGMVDATAEIRWQGGTVRQRALDGNPLREVNSSLSGNPGAGRARPTGQAILSRRDGRGDVDIVQQPSAANGYTTVIRVRDAQGGYGRYSFDVTMQ